MNKQEVISELISRAVVGEFPNEISRITFQDLVVYAKEHGYKWDMNDIGVNQKIDFLRSIVKNRKN